MIWKFYDISARYLKRLFYRVFGNVLMVCKASHCEGVTVKKLSHCTIALYGNSKLVIEEGAILKGCKIMLIDSDLSIGKNAKLINTEFTMRSSKFLTDDNVELVSYMVSMSDGLLQVCEDSKFIRQDSLKSYISIESGRMMVSKNNVIKCDIIVRFGGTCVIGQYNCINEGSELRCDELLTIGDYNMISYNCNIWDTNTHCMYDSSKRRKITNEHFPYIGVEIEKPKTLPVKIGNDCWIGKNVSVLKGTDVGNEVVIGTGAVVSNQKIPMKTIVVPPKAIILK